MGLTPDYLFERRGPGGQFPSLAEMVDVRGICWEWVGSTDIGGYGQVVIGDRRRQAHRVFYEILVGAIPEGLILGHLCRNRRCVFPDHLEPVTPIVNIRRGLTGNNQRLKTHCPRGHPYEGENLTINKQGARVCRTCRIASNRRYHANITGH